MNSIDLFSGCGGMTLGFHWAGFNSVLASDIDENCEKTFTKNFPETPFLCGDLSEFTKEDFDSVISSKQVDVILGGPPCQGFSLANKRRNKVSEDPRNKLFYEFVKTIDWYNPKAFVMENVKGLLSMQSGQVMKQILEEFQSAGQFGYEVGYEVLKASDYGVPQSRERVIVIGIRKDLYTIPVFPPKKEIQEITVGDAISDLPSINAGEGEASMPYLSSPKNVYQKLMRKHSTQVFNHVAMKHTQRLIERFKAIKPGQNLLDVWETHGAVKRGSPNEKSKIKFSQNNQRLFKNKPAPTIAASFQSNFIHPYLDRNFTAREGARLQSFPDDFIFEGMRTKMSWEKGLSQYQQIGNAVPPLMAFEIALTLKSVLENDKTKPEFQNSTAFK
ncbi:DNA (cytosine-5)-methyltransferase 1 [Flavobacteriaceae bacterium MAR_2010_72]|nr:DNA (cytosine-5)-methyltransferase 1 [Flavobacteriaceae bacterium MAR_2010_72]